MPVSTVPLTAAGIAVGISCRVVIRLLASARIRLVATVVTVFVCGFSSPFVVGVVSISGGIRNSLPIIGAVLAVLFFLQNSFICALGRIYPARYVRIGSFVIGSVRRLALVLST